MKLFDKLFRGQRPPRAGQRVAIRAGSVVTEVGAASILHGLFSSISANLEPGGWGTRFPIAMNRLYQGIVPTDEAAGALAELLIVEQELSGLPVSRLVWDYDDRAAAPSPHYRAPADARSLADFFVTVNGLNLLRAGSMRARHASTSSSQQECWPAPVGVEVRSIPAAQAADLGGCRGFGRRRGRGVAEHAGASAGPPLNEFT